MHLDGHSTYILPKYKHALYKNLHLNICVHMHIAYTQLDQWLSWCLDLTNNYQNLLIQLQNSSREKFTPFQEEILLEFSSSNQAILQSASRSHFRVLKIAFSPPSHYYLYPTVIPKSLYNNLKMLLKAVLS